MEPRKLFKPTNTRFSSLDGKGLLWVERLLKRAGIKGQIFLTFLGMEARPQNLEKRNFECSCPNKKE